ncbi:MAG: preprotein translocase subunit SecY [Phycisphaerales bacterium]|nr:preprotein translocase subunit SecY [Phycisphaerales bacterium]
MFQAFLNIFRISELRNRVLFTVGMLVVYRIGFWIPLPGVDQTQITEYFGRAAGEGGNLAASQFANYVAIFSGGALGQSTIFGLGIMPYISAAIIFQLLGSAITSLKELKKEAGGQQKIQEYTRYATIGLCVVQGIGWLTFMRQAGLVYLNWVNNPLFWLAGVLSLTAGTIFLMWLGEQIDKYGIGNGVSLIITGGILARMPSAVGQVIQGVGAGTITQMKIIFLVVAFFGVVAGAVLITVAQRRIPIQQAKHTRGRRVYGGGKSYLPLRVNHGGVMPIIFASSLMIFPSVIFSAMSGAAGDATTSWFARAADFLSTSFMVGEYPYILVYIFMVYVFSYFWTTVQFNPEEMSDQLRQHGSFIPGLRPGPRTADYLETVLERITYVGAGFLAVIAVLPMVVNKWVGVDQQVSAFLGGTGLLIVVSVGLDLVQRIEANLLMRNYAGFLGGGGGEKRRGPRIRSSR